MIKGGVEYKIVSDHLGSVRLVVNTQNNQVVQRINVFFYIINSLLILNWIVGLWVFIECFKADWDLGGYNLIRSLLLPVVGVYAIRNPNGVNFSAGRELGNGVNLEKLNRTISYALGTIIVLIPLCINIFT